MEKLKTLLLLVILFTVSSCNYMNTKIVKNATVTGKERINNSESSYYLIFTDKGEFTIVDEMFRGNFSSSTWYGMIKEGHCYNFKVGGYRNGFFSMYPNIHSKPFEVECVFD